MSFSDMLSRIVLEDYCALMKGEKSEGRDGNGNNEDVQQGYGQETDAQKEAFEFTIILIT